MVMLSVKNISKAYASKQVVDHVSFDIKKGEIFGFLGPNGAGKSTTIEIIAGLKKKTGGVVTINGKEMTDKDRYNYLGVQLQQAELYGNLTVKETLNLFLSFHNRKAFIDEHIHLTKLEAFLNQKVKSLSGGQKQRLSLSLSLANDPEILILDEPTVGLDPQSRRLLWDIILSLKQKGKTILLTTHFMDEAQRLCDRVAIMNEGKLLFVDTVDHLLNQIDKRFSIVIETTPDIYPFLNVEHLSAIIVRDDENVVIKTDEIDEAFQKVMKQIEENELELKSIVIKEANLEDLFIQLTGKELRE
ncbi:ABC transporter ATP-binding protein [Virgibacillus sp. 6R]|uniref:ABC transporter ATP-binding protein n=1 Tax=Metabacillus sp. 22489 TaxID=3453928 RepID=UPI0011A11CCB